MLFVYEVEDSCVVDKFNSNIVVSPGNIEIVYNQSASGTVGVNEKSVSQFLQGLPD